MSAGTAGQFVPEAIEDAERSTRKRSREPDGSLVI